MIQWFYSLSVTAQRWIGISILVLIILSVIFGVSSLLKKFHLRRLYGIRCEIFLKSGDRMIVRTDVRKDYFTISTKDDDGKKVNKMYFIIKENIRNNIRQRFLIGTAVEKFLQYDEDCAYPFMYTRISKKKVDKIEEELELKFLGAKRAYQFYKENIFEKIGGIGNKSFDNVWIYVVAGVITLLVIVFLMKSKGA